jgi:hypothetical protein
MMALVVAPRPAEARTFGEFLKDLGNSIVRPQKQRSKSRQKTRSKDGKQGTIEEGPLTSPSPGASVSPVPLPVRVASAAPEVKGKKRDVPYGIPVADRPGFVTSPYAPNEGLVDVRPFPSGTEVKDPYTGKVFLTP